MEKDSGQNPNILYDLGVLGQDEGVATEYWGSIPSRIGELPEMIDSHVINSEGLETLKEVLIDYHKRLGIYSPKMEENLSLLSNGSILAGQQPVILGGPGFIGNKLGILAATSKILKEEGMELAPVFMVGDYDGLQKELGRTYFPNPISGQATILDAEHAINLPEDTVIHTVPIPNEDWLIETLGLINSSFNGFKKQVKDGTKRKVLEERWDHLQTFFRLLHFNSEKFNDFFSRIWGTIANKINDYGIIFLPTSLPKIRELYIPPLFKFIEGQEKYIKTFNDTHDRLEKIGFSPTLPKRNHHYLPIYFECPCTDFRVSLKLFLRDIPMAEGECKNCGHTVEIPLDEPTAMHEYSNRIGLRVDSSQVAFQDLLNIKVRISGPGEIAYYSVVAPAIRSIGFNTPIFFKYKRAFYNSPWIEKLGKLLVQRNQPALHNDELFQILKDQLTAARGEDKQLWHESEVKMKNFIESQFSSLLKFQSKLDVQKYLSWMFGRFTPEKFGQEVSWIWIDMALQTGLSDYIPTYERMYNKFSKPGFFHFINTTL